MVSSGSLSGFLKPVHPNWFHWWLCLKDDMCGDDHHQEITDKHYNYISPLTNLSTK